MTDVPERSLMMGVRIALVTAATNNPAAAIATGLTGSRPTGCGRPVINAHYPGPLQPNYLARSVRAIVP